MSQTIWKFALGVEGVVDVPMPAGARVLHLGVQDAAIMVWALVDTKARVVRRRFHIVGTGDAADDVAELPYVGSVQQVSRLGITFVWHVFDGGAQEESTW